MPTRYRVEFTRIAERDLRAILGHIAADSPLNAHKFVERLALQISTLEQHPERCPSIPENEKVGAMYRHLLYGDYRTLFRVAEKTVLIIRILHGARLLEEAMLELKE